MSRRSGPRIERTGPGGGSSTPDEDPAEDPEEDLPEELQNEDTRDTSIGDITQEADAERFDRTYLAEKEDFQIGGELNSPAPFPLQTLPRLAYVINYNVVYDEERERWVPQKKSDLGASLSSGIFKTDTQSLPDSGALTTVTFNRTGVNSLGAADTSGNKIIIPADGEYLVSFGVRWQDAGNASDLDADLGIPGGPIQLRASPHPQSGSDDPIDGSASGVRALSEGDELQVRAGHKTGSGISIRGDRIGVFLDVTQLRTT